MASVQKMVCLALTYMLIALAITVKATIVCNQVFSTLEPCLSYVQGDVSTPPPGCCNGASAVFNNAKTTPDRQDTCQCLKDTANEFPAMFKPDRVASLPKDCHLNLPFVISTSTNCKSIK